MPKLSQMALCFPIPILNEVCVMKTQQGLSIIECLVTLGFVTLMMIVINRSLINIQAQELQHWHQQQSIIKHSL